MQNTSRNIDRQPTQRCLPKQVSKEPKGWRESEEVNQPVRLVGRKHHLFIDRSVAYSLSFSGPLPTGLCVAAAFISR